MKCLSHLFTSEGTLTQHVLVLVILTLVIWFRWWLSGFSTKNSYFPLEWILSPAHTQEKDSSTPSQRSIKEFLEYVKCTPVINIMRSVRLYPNYLFDYYYLLLPIWLLIDLVFPLNVEWWHVVNSKIFVGWQELKQGSLWIAYKAEVVKLDHVVVSGTF